MFANFRYQSLAGLATVVLTTMSRPFATAFSSPSPTPERQPWDALRFVRQSSRFVTLPNPFLAGRKTDAKVVSPGDTIWTPGSASNLFSFAPLDDVVMGGVSSSSIDNETGLWKGTVSSANSGGFVGIRSTPFSGALDMRGCTGIELRIKGGDGKRFKSVVRDSTEFNGVCWTSSFDASRGTGQGATALFATKNGADKICTVRLPFAKMTPTIFARSVENQGFEADNVVGLQLAYSKFEYDGDLNPNFSLGDFSLQIVEINAY